ncbi:hypothetical protein ABEJ45_10325, partial [Geobacillus thermoleovorans]
MGQTFQDGAIHFICAPKRINHLRFRIFGLRILSVVSKLEIRHGRSVFVSVKMRAFGVAIFIPGGEQALLMELFR